VLRAACWLGAGAIAAGVLSAGCGASSSLPAAEACQQATPVPVTVSATGTPSTRPYFNAVNSGLEQLQRTSAQFIERWPSRRFSRDRSFREELAQAAEASACIAERVLSARPPGDRAAEYDAALDTILAGYIDAMRVGRQAAETRNVSKYRDWLAAVDALPGQLELLRTLLPR
jgi:hypothetical protein